MRPLITTLALPQQGGMMITQAIAGPGGTTMVAIPQGASPAQGALGAPAQASMQALPVPMSGVQSMIDIAQVEGQVKESSVRKVGEIVTKHPDEATSILRSWLHQTA